MNALVSQPRRARPPKKKKKTPTNNHSDAFDDPDNVFRILISSDNHLGAWEKDEIRKQDSFAAFDEVFQLAREYRADIVLLGGDLFHDNRPSRATVVKAMSTLSKYCLVKPRHGHSHEGVGRNGDGGRSGYEVADGTLDREDGEDGDGGSDEEPKVSIVNRVDGLLAG